MVGTTLSHYRIISELGRGGMGIVYRAEDVKLDRPVAVKVLPPAALTSDDDRKRFYREAKAAAKLHHPHIASVFEIGEAVSSDAPHGTEPSPFIAMEFIDGEPLSEVIGRGPVKLDEAVRIAGQIALALDAAHEEDVVHRDIKAQNVMLTKKGEVKVLDFGLAKTAASTQLTKQGSTVGTIAYMSPEQARGETVDRRADIWALGVTLYEMIAGRLPFGGDYEQAVVYSILNEEPEPLTAIRTGVPMRLEWIVSKMIAKDAAHRYQSAAEAIVDLEAVDLSQAGSSGVSSASSAPAARPSDTGTRAMALVRRYGLPVVVTAAVVFAATKGLSGSDAPAVSPIEYPMAFPGVVSMGDPEMSPDGTEFAFQGRDTSGRVGIFEKTLTPNGELHFLYAGGAQPVYSPDGRLLTYARGGPIPIHASGGGPAQSIPGTDGYRAHAWLDDRTLLATGPNGLFRVTLDGDIEPIVQPDTAQGHIFSRVNDIDASRRFATVNIHISGGQSPVQMGIVDVEQRSYWVLQSNGADFGYFVGDDYLMYFYSGSANADWPGIPMLQKLSGDRRTLVGTAVPAFPNASDEQPGYDFDIGSDGSLYDVQNHVNHKYHHLLRYDLIPGARRQYVQRFEAGFGWTPSPDGRVLAQTRRGTFSSFEDREIELLHLEDMREESILRADSVGGNLFWGPAGDSIYFNRVVDGRAAIMQIPVDRSSPATVVLEDALILALARDGRLLAFARPVYGEGRAVLGYDGIFLHDMISGATRMHRESLDGAGSVAISPDGRYLAFDAVIEGESGVFVERIYERNPLKAGDGFSPIWDPDGNYVYFTGTPLHSLKRVPITLTPGFRITGAEETLFDQWFSGAFTIDFRSGVAYTNAQIDVDVTKDAYIIRTEHFDEYVGRRMEQEP